MITRFWWVRHGPTHSQVINGWSDVPADLSNTDAIARLNRFLPKKALLVSSDLQRARMTADTLAGKRTRMPDDRDMREGSQGSWEGKSSDEIARTDPELSREVWQSPGDVAAPGGESWNTVCARVTLAVARLNVPEQRDVVAVAHHGPILAALQIASGISAKATLAFVIKPLSVTRLEYLHDARVWRIGFVNHIA